jgi:hypothetical protein
MWRPSSSDHARLAELQNLELKKEPDGREAWRALLLLRDGGKLDERRTHRLLQRLNER